MKKIRKIQVTNGVYWVEVPQAGLYLLCGCPADSVKHLVKRGLIVTREENGTTFETGPNAILLSDVLVQNGSFANLTEFPVLQMLYKQGMLIPNHPNNTGAKPILIGSRDQVQAQMQYIFRGNYGLVSRDEVIEAGAPSALLDEMMGVKLKFAFGKIHTTQELLDTRIVENGPVEIKNGVTVRRLRLNVFEFDYQGDSVTVDLNLAPNQHYGVPYSLGFHYVKREYFGVIHSGQGDGWDSRHPCASSILMFQGKMYLIDAGPNFLHSLMALGISINEIEGIFHTHAHDDHFADLPALMRADHHIKYYATPFVRASVAKKLSALVLMDEEDFADYFEIHDLALETWNDIDGLEVMPLFSPHPVETNIFIFRTLWGDGYHSYAHFLDIAAFDILDKMTTDTASPTGISRAFCDKIKQDYLQPVDLKKVDAGRELIHGNAEDFREDASGKVILAHTSYELSVRQKEIGSGAPFGTVDVLIPASQDYVQQYAAQFLHSYFPSVPDYELKILLNNPVATYNPESIILKSRTVPKEIYLILTGNVEQIQSERGVRNLLSAGALVGEIAGLTKSASSVTYRAVNFVQALRLPCALYLEFVKRNGLLDSIKQLQDKREFLQTTYLFGEVISYPTQNRLAQAMQTLHYPAGQKLCQEKQAALYVVKHGQVHRCIGDNVFETLKEGDFFGEEGVLFGIPSLFRVHTSTPTEVYQIPDSVLLDIPIVRWKLFEAFEKRMGLILESDLVNVPIFYWRKEYSINVHEMDKHHRQLFERANKFYETVEAGEEKRALEEALDFLVHYTQFHFTQEEALVKRYDYPEYETHSKKHERFIKHVLKLQTQVKSGDATMSMDFLSFLKNWIINHILTEDRKYAQFLNGKGIF